MLELPFAVGYFIFSLCVATYCARMWSTHVSHRVPFFYISFLFAPAVFVVIILDALHAAIKMLAGVNEKRKDKNA